MVGKVIATVAGVEVAATLDDDGRWSCPGEPAVADYLNACHDPRPGYSPSRGRFGVRQLHAAATSLGGEVEIEPRDPGPPGRIY